MLDYDYPSRCRIVVTDTSGQNQRAVAWGFRSHYYDPADTAALFFEAEDLFDASATALAGASNGSVNKVVQEAAGDWEPVLALRLPDSAQMTHVGSYRVWLRYYCYSVTSQLQLQWSQGSGVAVPNDIVTPPGADAFYIADLGTIRVGPSAVPGVPAGWTGNVFAAPSVDDAAIGLDCVYLQPLDESAGVVYAASDFAAIFADLPAALQTEGMWRQGSIVGLSSLWGPCGSTTGDLPRLPPSGLEGRPAQLFVKPTRGDLDQGDDTDAGLDPFTVQVFYRPCWLSRP